MRIGIGAAVYITAPEHLSAAREALGSMLSKHQLSFDFWVNCPMTPEIHALLSEYASPRHIHQNDENNVSRAWNRAIDCRMRAGCDYVIVPNLDVVMHPEAIDNLVAFASRNGGPILYTAAPWFDRNGLAEAPLHDVSVPYPHFSCFMVDHRLFRYIGPFDEMFKPAYNEDLDMHWRIKLAGLEAVQYEGARFFHMGSATIRFDPDLRERNGATHAANDRYFAEKWRFKPPTADDPFIEGMYRFPFNDPERVGFEQAYANTWR